MRMVLMTAKYWELIIASNMAGKAPNVVVAKM